MPQGPDFTVETRNLGDGSATVTVGPPPWPRLARGMPLLFAEESTGDLDSVPGAGVMGLLGEPNTAAPRS